MVSDSREMHRILARFQDGTLGRVTGWTALQVSGEVPV